LNVSGATGTIKFDRESKSRHSDSISFYMLNGQILPNRYGKDVLIYRFANVAVREDQEWDYVEDFIYSDGSTKAHTPLRDVEEIKNYTFPSFQYVSLVFCSLGLIVTFGSMAMTCVYRTSHVITAANATYLLLSCLGTAGCFSLVLILQLNENMGITTTTLDKFCRLYGALHIVAVACFFVPLYAKLKWLNLSIIERQDSTYNRFLIVPFILVTPPLVIYVYALISGSISWRKEVIEVDEYGFVLESDTGCGNAFIGGSRAMNISISVLAFLFMLWMCRYAQRTRLKIEHETKEGRNLYFVLLFHWQFTLLYVLCSCSYDYVESEVIFILVINHFLTGVARLMWIIYPFMRDLVRSLYAQQQEAFEGRSIDISVIEGVEEQLDDEVSGLTNCDL